MSTNQRKIALSNTKDERRLAVAENRRVRKAMTDDLESDDFAIIQHTTLNLEGELFSILGQVVQSRIKLIPS